MFNACVLKKITILTLLFLIGTNTQVKSADTLKGLENVPEIVADINGHEITRLELLRELVGSNGLEAIDRLVRRKLVEQTAQSMNVSVSDEDIDKEFNIDKRNLMEELIHTPWDRGGNKVFPIEDILKSRFRMSVADYKKNVIRQKILIQRCVAQDYQPTEAELRQVFVNNRDFFQPPVKYRACHILISPLDPRDMSRSLSYQSATSQMTQINRERQHRIDLYRDHKVDLKNAPSVNELDPLWKQAREKAEKVLTEVKLKHITWDQALRQYTQDPHDHPWYDREIKRTMPPWREMQKPPLPPGDVGYFHANGPLVKEFYEAAQTLNKEGEIGGPVRTEYGYHLIKITEIQRQPELTFEQCRERVERLSLEKYIEVRSQTWIDALVDSAQLKTERAMLWPPLLRAHTPLDPGAGPVHSNVLQPESAEGRRINNLSDLGQSDDPLVGTVNEAPLKRSEVWRELIQADGDEALDRLINLEVVMTMLKNMGLERMEWECANPRLRPQQTPQPQPIKFSRDEVDRELTDDRVRCDAENEFCKSRGELEISFNDYIFQHYGQSVIDYQRSLEAQLILRKAIQKRIPCDDGTLQVQFALTRDAYSEPNWYEIKHILIVPEGGMLKADRNALTQALFDAEQVRKTFAAAPDTWSRLVKIFSKDSEANKLREGWLGACYYDDRNKELPESAILHRGIIEQKLQPLSGMASAPIRTYRGFHVVKIEKIHTSRPVEFKEIRDKLERDYIQEHAKMYTDVWVRALKRKSLLKNFLSGETQDAGTEDLPQDRFPLPK